MKQDLRILVIDDSRTSRRLLQTYAQATEFTVQVDEAGDGQEGLAMLKEASYDCIFLDYVLPDLDGLQVLRQIKQGGIDTPVVVLTGQGSEPLAVEMMKAGAADYLPKSDLTPDLLYRCMRNAVQLADASRRSREAAENILIAKREIEQAHRAQSEFFTRMSHEIRTPLNVILGTSDLLKGTQLTPEQQEYVQTCQRAGNMLMVLINDILDLAKVRSGELELKNVEFNLRESFENTCAMMAVQARGKNLRFSHVFDPKLPTLVKGDADRLTQILVNLTGNAIKFTRKGEVKVTAIPEPELRHPCAVRFIVEDTGIGIPRDKLEIIFTSFHQADKSVSHEYGGTGLGLAITKNLVEKMNGRIWVESQPNIGSRFYVTVVFNPAPSSPESQAPRSDPDEAPADAERSIRVLVAEDTFDNRLLVKSFLKRAPVEVDFAFNGRDACEKFSANRYDVILMDMEMPEMNGIEATRRIRDMERDTGKDVAGQIPIIALTAHSFVEERDKCMAAGCSDFLMKPFKREALIDKIRQHAGQP